MFTLISKFLAFAYLLLSLAALTWSVSVYFNRPTWYDPVPEAVDRGNDVVTFAQLKQDVDALGKAANAASLAWGDQLKVLEETEKRRADRVKEYEVRVAWMKTGNPKKDGAAFFKPVHVKDAAGKETSVLDLTKIGDPVIGPDGQPLRGADTLMINFSKDVAAVADLEKQIEDQIKEYDRLGTEITKEEIRLLAMFKVRESVQAELFYLSSFEVNVYETRETVFRRKRQLVQRLAELGGK